jgi:hypothetical protein
MSLLLISGYFFTSIGGSQLAFSATYIQPQLNLLETFPSEKIVPHVTKIFLFQVHCTVYIYYSSKCFHVEKLTTRGAEILSDSENSSQIHSP